MNFMELQWKVNGLRAQVRGMWIQAHTRASNWVTTPLYRQHSETAGPTVVLLLSPCGMQLSSALVWKKRIQKNKKLLVTL